MLTRLDRPGKLLARSRSLQPIGPGGWRPIPDTQFYGIWSEACRLVSDAMETPLVKVMELDPDGRTLLVRAGVGWKLTHYPTPQVVRRYDASRDAG
jgi:hypothetical protein